MARMFAGWLVVVSVLVAGTLAHAHHSVLGFDGTRPVTLRGVVAEVVWSHPHTYIAIEVADGAERGRWLIESESPVVLQRLGWTRMSVRHGDRIVTIGGPSRQGERIMRCESLTTANGTRLPCYPAVTQ
jgi:hypothetical protein